MGLVDPAVTLRAAPDEVAQVLVPLAPLVDPQRHVRRSYIRDGRKRGVWVIEDNRYNIWGLSVPILVDLGRRMAPAMSGGGLLRAEDTTGTGGLTMRRHIIIAIAVTAILVMSLEGHPGASCQGPRRDPAQDIRN